MINYVISTFFRDFSMVMLITAIAIAILITWRRRGRPGNGLCGSLFAWLLLLPIGLTGIYTFITHVFFPEMSAREIGWEVSPFQFEVGIADLTVGVLGVLAFRGNYSFRLAAAIGAILWYGGDAIGHVRQMIVAHNYAAGNAGPWFWTDVLVPLLLVVCAAVVWQQKKARQA